MNDQPPASVKTAAAKAAITTVSLATYTGPAIDPFVVVTIHRGDQCRQYFCSSAASLSRVIRAQIQRCLLALGRSA